MPNIQSGRKPPPLPSLKPPGRAPSGMQWVVRDGKITLTDLRPKTGQEAFSNLTERERAVQRLVTQKDPRSPGLQYPGSGTAFADSALISRGVGGPFTPSAVRETEKTKAVTATEKVKTASLKAKQSRLDKIMARITDNGWDSVAYEKLTTSQRYWIDEAAKLQEEIKVGGEKPVQKDPLGIF